MPLCSTAGFAHVPGPRPDTHNHSQPRTDIPTIASCVVIAAADGWKQIAQYGRRKQTGFLRALELPNGGPSHDTFNRACAQLDPEGFADRFGRCMTSASEATGLVRVASDAKSARRAPKGPFAGCLHSVGAWAVEDRPILGRRGVFEGGHAITPLADRLEALGLEGALRTIDAAGCQTEIVPPSRDQAGDYPVTVEGEQPSLQAAVVAAFEPAGEPGFEGRPMVSSVEDGRGRPAER